MVNVAAGDSRAYLGRLAMALGVIIWGTLLAWSAGAAQPPRVAAAETTHDFGQVFEDHQLTHTFTLENLGKEPLEIREVDPDCDCTIPSYDRRIAPGGKGKITLSIKPYSVMRQFQKNTVIRFRDAEVPDLTLVLKGVAQPIIEIQPNHIIRLRGSVAEPLSGRIRFTSHLSFPWEITKFETNIADKIDINLRPELPGKVYILEVRNKSRETGHYAGKIDLFTNSQKRPRLLVRVFADLTS
jgi:hypothetical protein